MFTVLTSGKAAPGATTALWALALTWPQELFVIDADPAGGDVATGPLGGRAIGDRGLLSWSVASRPGALPGEWTTESLPGDAAALLAEHTVEPAERSGLRVLI